MNKTGPRTYRLETLRQAQGGLSLSPLTMALHQAKLYSPPETWRPRPNTDEQLASKLIENMKRPYRRPSPFSNWMGQPFPHEYKEMVAADV